MKKFEFSVIVALIISVTVSFMGAFASECDSLSEKVLRLHVIAKSDSEYDQALKLKVRDSVLALDFLNNAKNKNEATQLVKNNLDLIKKTAEDTLFKNGCNDSVSVEIVRMLFPLKRYDNFTMPGGIYDALRITVGEGEGKNWWCVMFPPLCYGACIESETLSGSEELLENSPQFEVRFKIVELVKKLFDKKTVRYEK